MLPLSDIISENRAVAERAAAVNRVPFTLTSEDLEDARRGVLDHVSIPDLGDYRPDGWDRVDLENWYPGDRPPGVDLNMNAYFVDYSGFGIAGEPALTTAEFFHLARPGYGYAVIESGQFQLYVGVFEKVTDPA